MIDSHAHVGFPDLAGDEAGVAERAREAGVRWVEIGTEVGSSKRALTLAEKFSEDIIGATVGVHPDDITSLTEKDWQTLEKLMDHPRAIAVGEIGLDYYREGTREQQFPILDRFVKLAVAKNLPVVFHVRSGKAADAHTDMLDFLRGLPSNERPRGVMHTFSGTWAQAEGYLALGMCVSISGVVTFKNAPDMQAVAQRAPLDRLLIETDSPFLTPEPHRGARNEPAYVVFVAQKIAELRGISLAEVTTATERNALALFGQ